MRISQPRLLRGRRGWVVLAVGLLATAALGFTSAMPATALPGWPVVREGNQGANVKTVQYLLRQHGSKVEADGVFGSQTRKAVRSFQTRKRIGVDGMVGPQTWPHLAVNLRPGDRGAAVKALQVQLNKHGYKVAVDGAYGKATGQAVTKFKSSRKISGGNAVADGTWRALTGSGPSGGGGGGSGNPGSPGAGNHKLPIPRGALPRGEYDDPHHDYPAIDLPVGTGTPAYAVTAGRVTVVNDSRCGRGVILTTGSGAVFTYCHFSRVSVGSGARVGAGARLGSTGSTGSASGPHLHLQLRAGGVLRCPQRYLLAIYDGRNPPSLGSLPTSGCSY